MFRSPLVSPLHIRTFCIGLSLSERFITFRYSTRKYGGVVQRYCLLGHIHIILPHIFAVTYAHDALNELAGSLLLRWYHILSLLAYPTVLFVCRFLSSACATCRVCTNVGQLRHVCDSMRRSIRLAMETLFGMPSLFIIVLCNWRPSTLYVNDFHLSSLWYWRFSTSSAEFDAFAACGSQTTSS